MLDHTIEDLRRIIGRLSPRVLEELGLLAAIRKEVREIVRNGGIKAQLDLPAELHLDRELEVALYRALQEALHNIVKHSRARSFRVRLECGDHDVCLSVEDDGVGFSARRQPRDAFGLIGMRERVAALGGSVRIRSRKGEGVTIRVVLPARLLNSVRKENSRRQPAAASFLGQASNSEFASPRFAAAR